MNVLFLLSGICFAGMVLFLIRVQQPGMYPPKKILLKRAVLMGLCGIPLFLIALLILIFRH